MYNPTLNQLTKYSSVNQFCNRHIFEIFRPIPNKILLSKKIINLKILVASVA